MKSYTQIHVEMIEVLLEVLLQPFQGRVLTNRKLCDRLQIKLAPIETGTYLNEITRFCLERDFPLITALVVNTKTWIPGASFYDLCEEFNLWKQGESRQTLHETVLNQVWSYDKWSDFIRYFPLHDSIVARIHKMERCECSCPLYPYYLCAHRKTE